MMHSQKKHQVTLFLRLTFKKNMFPLMSILFYTIQPTSTRRGLYLVKQSTGTVRVTNTQNKNEISM